METEALIITDHSDLLVEAHPPVPENMNPLADLPAEIEQMGKGEQIETLTLTYKNDVAIGMGLTLLMLQCADGAWQWRLRERTEREVNRMGGPESAVAMMTLYLAREKQMCWAAEALDLNPATVLDHIRGQIAVEHDYGGSGYMRSTDKEAFIPPDMNTPFEEELNERHGEAPVGWESSVYVTGDETEQELYELLASHFKDHVARMTGIEEMLTRVESVHSIDTIDRIKTRAGENGAKEAFREEMDYVLSREAELVWSARELGLSPARVISFIQDRL